MAFAMVYAIFDPEKCQRKTAVISVYYRVRIIGGLRKFSGIPDYFSSIPSFRKNVYLRGLLSS